MKIVSYLYDIHFITISEITGNRMNLESYKHFPNGQPLKADIKYCVCIKFHSSLSLIIINNKD